VRNGLASVPGLSDVSGWRIGFAAAGLIGVIWCGTFYTWFRNDPVEKRSVNAAEIALIREGATPGDGPGHGPIELGMWRALLTNRSLWALAALYFFGSFGWSFFVSWMPDYLQRFHGVSFNASEDI